MRTGDVLAGRYRLEELVGAGGVGVVWRATDVELTGVLSRLLDPEPARRPTG